MAEWRSASPASTSPAPSLDHESRSDLQQTRGFSPITTGLAFLPMTATIMTAAILGLTRLQQRFGPRALIAAGMTLGALGTLHLTQIRVGSSYAAHILPALIVLGAGLGLVFSTSIANATLGVEPSEAGVAAATVNASQRVGGSLGVALLWQGRKCRPPTHPRPRRGRRRSTRARRRDEPPRDCRSLWARGGRPCTDQRDRVRRRCPRAADLDVREADRLYEDAAFFDNNFLRACSTR